MLLVLCRHISGFMILDIVYLGKVLSWIKSNTCFWSSRETTCQCPPNQHVSLSMPVRSRTWKVSKDTTYSSTYVCWFHNVTQLNFSECRLTSIHESFRHWRQCACKVSKSLKRVHEFHKVYAKLGKTRLGRGGTQGKWIWDCIRDSPTPWLSLPSNSHAFCGPQSGRTLPHASSLLCWYQVSAHDSSVLSAVCQSCRWTQGAACSNFPHHESSPAYNMTVTLWVPSIELEELAQWHSDRSPHLQFLTERLGTGDHT